MIFKYHSNHSHDHHYHHLSYGCIITAIITKIEKEVCFLHRSVCECAGDCPLPAGRHYNMACVVTLAHQSRRTEAAHKGPYEPRNAD